MSNTQCPPAEELASLLEGRSGRRARRRLLGHLNACEPCFQVFSAAAQFQADFPEYAVAPAPRSRPALAWMAAAAVLAVAGAGALLVWRSPASEPERAALVELTELFPVEGPTALSEELWPAVSVELRSADPSAGAAAFEAGVMMLGAAVNLEEGRIDDARARLEAVRGVLAPFASFSGAREALAADEPRPAEIDPILERELDSSRYALGKWAEAGRLAARTRETSVLSSEVFQQEGRVFRAEELSSEVSQQIELVRGILDRGEHGERELDRLEEAFTRIILLSSRR